MASGITRGELQGVAWLMVLIGACALVGLFANNRPLVKAVAANPYAPIRILISGTQPAGVSTLLMERRYRPSRLPTPGVPSSINPIVIVPGKVDWLVEGLRGQARGQELEAVEVALVGDAPARIPAPIIGAVPVISVGVSVLVLGYMLSITEAGRLEAAALLVLLGGATIGAGASMMLSHRESNTIAQLLKIAGVPFGEDEWRGWRHVPGSDAVPPFSLSLGVPVRRAGPKGSTEFALLHTDRT